ncbi:MAG: glycoside hydrolase family 20 zincin-like fold domain-containing protein [Acidobacteriota bacterium]
MTRVDRPNPAVLAPPPRNATNGDGAWIPDRHVGIAGPPDGLEAAFDWLTAALGRHGFQLDRQVDEASIRVAVADAGSESADEAYRLRVDIDGVKIAASTLLGAFRALTTLVQWLDLHPPGSAEITGLRVEDRPDLATRGVLFDISRNRVPRVAVLEGWIDRLARLKINQVQLYIEHTFAYVGHETVWRGWSPLTGDDLRRLDRFCRERRIDLVAHQNSFGHLHRWLVHEPYRRLAECPDGVDHPFSPEPEPFGLCATDPGSLDLLRDLYDQLLPCLGGDELAVGLDETLDLGQCRTRTVCEARGKRAVYLDFVHRVHALVRERGRRMQMWGDMLVGETSLGSGETVDDLPDDTTFLAWGYEPDHPFDADLARFAAARDRGQGRRFFVCPGTGAWNTFTGRTRDAVINLASAAMSGRRHRADGLLITDWGDHGHLQPPPIAWPGLVAGACFAWNAEAAQSALDDPAAVPLATWLDRHWLADEAGALGRALIELGNAQRASGVRSMNGAPLFFALMMADGSAEKRRGVGLTVEGLDAIRERLDAALAPLPEARPMWDGAGPIVDELRWVADVARTSADLAEARLRPGDDRPLDELSASTRGALHSALDTLVERLRPLWLARSREGGLDASITRLLRVRSGLE